MSTQYTEQILLRMTPEQKAFIKKKAAKYELSIQAYVLSGALQFDDPSHNLTLPAVKRAVVPIIAQLRRVGNNLNQLARRQNSGRSINRTDLLANVEEIERVCLMIKHRPE